MNTNGKKNINTNICCNKIVFHFSWRTISEKYQAQAMVELVRRLGWSYVSTVAAEVNNPVSFFVSVANKVNNPVS